MKSEPILLYLSIIVFAGVMLGIVPAWIVLFLMFLGLFTLNRHENIIALTFAFVPVLGVFFSYYSIGIPASLLCLVFSFLLSIREISSLLKKNRRPLIYIIVLWAFMIAAYFLTGRTENSTDKIIVMSELILLYAIAVFILSSSSDLRLDKIAPIFLFSGIFLVAAAHDYSGYPSFHGLFDFETIRLEYFVRKHSFDSTGMSYHRIGMQVMCAIAFYLSTCKKIDIRTFVLFFACAWMSLVSGARQAVLGVIVIAAAWIAMRNGRKIKLWGIVLSILVVALLIFGLNALELDLFSLTFQSDTTLDESTGRDWLYPMMVIQSNPLTGLGFGNYENPFIDGEVYAHNIILEILCEMGLIGLLIITVIIVSWFIKERPILLHRVSSGALATILTLPFLIRSMLSEDLSHNFVLFIIIFTLFSTSPSTSQLKNGKV